MNDFQKSQTHNRWLHCISTGQCFYDNMRFALRVKAQTAAYHLISLVDQLFQDWFFIRMGPHPIIIQRCMTSWLGRGGPFARSSNLIPLDFFFFWGFVKDACTKKAELTVWKNWGNTFQIQLWYHSTNATEHLVEGLIPFRCLLSISRCTLSES